MDATVIEELQIHTPLKTQRKTWAQDEILQAAAAALGKIMVLLQKETMAMSSRGVTRYISVTAEKNWVTKKKKNQPFLWTLESPNRDRDDGCIYLSVFWSKMKTNKSYTAFLILFFDLIKKYSEFCIILMVIELVAQSPFKFRQPRKLISVTCLALKYF